MSIIIALLRQPWMKKPTESRSDPFWEFGSFGLTGCHQRNLMNPGKAASLKDERFAFVQGGRLGFRLVFLTPPLVPHVYADRTEVRWSPVSMPFKYQCAPLILNAHGCTDVPELIPFIVDVNRSGWLGKFASRFRTRREPLPATIARQVDAVYRRALRRAGSQPALLAESYEEALPVLPPLVDRDRRRTYERLLNRVC